MESRRVSSREVKLPKQKKTKTGPKCKECKSKIDLLLQEDGLLWCWYCGSLYSKDLKIIKM